MSLIHLVFLPLVFVVIAIIYSSVGFGGGSLYIAFLVFVSIDYHLIPIIALLCNIAVVSINCYSHHKQGQLNLSQAFPFIILSIPASFIGGYMNVDKHTFIFLLATSLFVSSLLLMFGNKNYFIKRSIDSIIIKRMLFTSIGAGIGFLSGIVGIGGGIFLSPILLLFNLKKPNQTVSIASIYILVNSISGITGQMIKLNSTKLDIFSNFSPLIILFYLVMVIVGGLVGNKMRLIYFKENRIRQFTGVIILLASIKLFANFLQ